MNEQRPVINFVLSNYSSNYFWTLHKLQFWCTYIQISEVFIQQFVGKFVCIEITATLMVTTIVFG